MVRSTTYDRVTLPSSILVERHLVPQARTTFPEQHHGWALKSPGSCDSHRRNAATTALSIHRKDRERMENSESPRMRTGIVLTALVLASSAVLLGTTILDVALPRMTVALDLSNTAQQWVLNSYTLTLAGFLLIAGAIVG